MLFTPTNHDPVAISDSNGVAKGRVVTPSAAIGVLSNDSDLDHDQLSVGSVTEMILAQEQAANWGRGGLLPQSQRGHESGWRDQPRQIRRNGVHERRA
ncbi:hypothetical protein [Bradyrhizobium japonicum]